MWPTRCSCPVQVFGPAFRRQARWSVQQPVPELGEDETEDRSARMQHCLLQCGLQFGQYSRFCNVQRSMRSCCHMHSSNKCTLCRAVDRFYKFWFGFKSWREFPHPDEEDIEQAECREDRCLTSLDISHHVHACRTDET